MFLFLLLINNQKGTINARKSFRVFEILKMFICSNEEFYNFSAETFVRASVSM